MKNKIAIFTILFLSIACSSKIQEHQVNSFAFTHVTIINPTSIHPEEDMTVVIKGNCISLIGKIDKISIPKDVQVIDAGGKYLIPGLWDFHIHSMQLGWPVQGDNWFKENVELNKEIFFPLLIANGITGIRDMGGNWEVLKRWQDEIEEGRIIGPRMVSSGEMLISPNHPYGFNSFINILVNNEDDARQAVINLKNKGADFIKIISLPSEEVFLSVANEAKEQGMSVVGHADYISAIVASDSGYKSMEHLGGILNACTNIKFEYDKNYYDNKQLLDNYSEQKASVLFKHLLKNDTWICTTLVIYDLLFYNFYEIDTVDVRLNFIPTYWGKNIWLPYLREMLRDKTEKDKSRDKRTFERHIEVVNKLHDAGVKLLAGTDTASPFNIPGFSLHKELIFLTHAGLTPIEALRTATLNPAIFLGIQDSIGTIEEGKIADIVLLDANPLEDISNTQKINSVVVNGKLITRNDLDKMLVKVELVANKN